MRCWLVIGLVGLVSGAIAQPAFLDRRDLVTLALPVAAPLSEMRSGYVVEVDGKRVEVVHVSPGELASRPVSADFYNLPGTFQSKLGGSDWDPRGVSTELKRIAEGIYEWVGSLPAGRFEYKVAKGGAWDENWGRDLAPKGENLVLQVPRPQVVRIVVDFPARRVRNSVDDPKEITAPTTAPRAPEPVEPLVDSVKLELARPIADAEIAREIRVRIGTSPWRRVIARSVLNEASLTYAKDDLGCRASGGKTVFKVWSPVASRASVLIYESASGPERKRIPLTRGAGGVWYGSVTGNLHGSYYLYEFQSYGETRRAADVYCYAATARPQRSMVVDLSRVPMPRRTRPAWKHSQPPIIYEAHVRDFTASPASGVRPSWRGKYLGVAELNTHVPNTKQATGLSYLKDLGISALHLLPFQDFYEHQENEYNWGYITTLFNAPETQYASRPDDPLAAVRECKQMIRAVQNQGIAVVLDVVYNHSFPSEGEMSAFWQAVPYYWFRTNDRGQVLNESGVGNALNDDQTMVRKYIGDSLAYWAREYELDGFRFDLLGMFTPVSVREFARAIREVKPDAIVYGEPWTGGGPVRFTKGDQKGTGVAVFNDFFRGVFRGGTDDARPGWAMGAEASRDDVIRAIEGSTRVFAADPQESINYVSAHDNLTLRDKVRASMPKATEAEQEAAILLATQIVLFSQGIPFLEGGVEMGRTKGGNHNSYNGGDSVNQFDWAIAPRYAEQVAMVRKSIALRKQVFGTRKPKFEFLPAWKSAPGVVAYRIRSKEKPVLVVINPGAEAARVELPRDASSQVLPRNAKRTSSNVSISARSMAVFEIIR